MKFPRYFARHEQMSDPLEFLASVFGGDKPTADPLSWRPYVTLTFAQSLDAKIAGANGKQLILSGKESMIMTHWYSLGFLCVTVLIEMLG